MLNQPSLQAPHDLFIYFGEREAECLNERSRGREREREYQAHSLPSTEPHAGLDLTTLRSQPKPKPRVKCTQVPLKSHIFNEPHRVMERKELQQMREFHQDSEDTLGSNFL